jgi:hypothetical protein
MDGSHAQLTLDAIEGSVAVFNEFTERFGRNISLRANIVSEVAYRLLSGNADHASSLARDEYPFEPIPNKRQLYTDFDLIKSRDKAKSESPKRKSISDRRRQAIWNRDGYRDRYTGAKMVHPAALELLSVVMRAEFPYDNPPHGKYEATHICMWELWPSIDHVVPVSSGEIDITDKDSNLVTTSMLVNQLKSDYDLGELGWALRPSAPNLMSWDGLYGWAVAYSEAHTEVFNDAVSGKRLHKWLAK